MTIKPGWFVLALLVYCLVATVAWQRSERTLRAFRSSADTFSLTSVNDSSNENAAETPLWFPIPGAQLPEDSLYLPGTALTQG